MDHWLAGASFDEQRLLHDLHHHLPSQAPLKDFIHHNTLHALQDLPFDEAMVVATRDWGHRTYAPIESYRTKWATGEILPVQLERAMARAGLTESELMGELPELPQARPNPLPMEKPAQTEPGQGSAHPAVRVHRQLPGSGSGDLADAPRAGGWLVENAACH